MKKLTVIALIFAFAVQSTSQCWILTSFYINRNFIAANICVNRFEAIPVCKGSCVLEKRLNENDQQQKLPDLKIKEINLFYRQQIPDIIFVQAVGSSSCSFIPRNISFISSKYLRSIFRPPSSFV